MSRQPPQRDLAPIAQRLRFRYAKRGRLRFSSHRDFQRALERALRRAQIPMAFSAGFSPHPKISYANAAPTGAASEAEYVEIAVTRSLDPDAVRQALDEALPPGLDIVEVVEARSADFAARLQASQWSIAVPQVAIPVLQEAIDALMANQAVVVERVTKSGAKAIDVRNALIGVRVHPGEAGCAILEAFVRHTTPAVRPDDVVTALTQVAALVPPEPPRFTRLAQGPLDEATGLIGDPFAADRADPAETTAR